MDMKIDRIVLLPVAVLAVGAALMFLFLGMREDPPKRAPEVHARMVKAVVATPGSVQAGVVAFGTTTSAQPVDLFAEASGTILAGDLPFLSSQSFKSGDVLLRIDDRQIQLNRQSAVSDLLSALANVLPEIKVNFPGNYDIWQNYFDAVEFDAPVPPLPDAGSQKIKLFLSRYNVYKLYFSVRNLEISIEKHTIRAPFDGTIATANLTVGSSARNGSLLGTISNLQALEIEIPVPAQEVPWIDPEGPVRFTSTEFAGEWQGYITRVGKTISLATQTVAVYSSLQDPAATLPEGAFFEASFTGLQLENALEIPLRSIYDDRYVYVIRSGKLVAQDVTIARRQEETAILQNGLQPGDTLVTEPLQGVAPGMLATPQISAEGSKAR